jgi:hypothetical protein
MTCPVCRLNKLCVCSVPKTPADVAQAERDACRLLDLAPYDRAKSEQDERRRLARVLGPTRCAVSWADITVAFKPQDPAPDATITRPRHADRDVQQPRSARARANGRLA